MKKLMITLVAVAMAVASQAAVVNWTVTELKDSTGEVLDGGYAYVFSGNAGTYKAPADLKDALLKAATATDFESIVTANAVSGLGSAVASGTASETGVDLTTTGLPQSSSSQKYSQKIFALITDTETITDDTLWYVTELSTGQTIPKTTAVTAVSWTITDTGSATSKNWNKIGAVPEPTSGLLLLLGVAGLALRRRRA